MACCGPPEGLRDNDDWRYPRHVEWKRLVGGEDVPMVLAPSYDRPLLPATTVEVPNPLHTRSAQQWFTNLPDDTARAIMNTRRSMLREQQIMDAALSVHPKPPARDPRPTADMVLAHLAAVRQYRAAVEGRGRPGSARAGGRGPGGMAAAAAGQRPGTAPPGGTQAMHRMGVQLGLSQPSTPRAGGPLLQPQPNGLPPPVMDIIRARQQAQQQPQQQQPQYPPQGQLQQAAQPGQPLAQPPQGKFATMLRSISPFKGAATQAPQPPGQQPQQPQQTPQALGAADQTAPPGPWYKRVFRRGGAPAAAATPGTADGLAASPQPPPGQAPPGSQPFQPQAPSPQPLPLQPLLPPQQQALQPGQMLPPQPLQAMQMPQPSPLSPDQQLMMQQMQQLANQVTGQMGGMQLQQAAQARFPLQQGQQVQPAALSAAPPFPSVRPASAALLPAPAPAAQYPPFQQQQQQQQQQGYGAPAQQPPYAAQQSVPYGAAPPPYGTAPPYSVVGNAPAAQYGSIPPYQQQQQQGTSPVGLQQLQKPYGAPPLQPALSPPGTPPIPPPSPPPPQRSAEWDGFGLAGEVQSASPASLAPLPPPPSPLRGLPPQPPPPPPPPPPALELEPDGGAYGLGADVAEAEAGLAPLPPPPPPALKTSGSNGRSSLVRAPPTPLRYDDMQQESLDASDEGFGLGAAAAAQDQRVGFPPPGARQAAAPLPPLGGAAPLPPPGPRRLQRAPSNDDPVGEIEHLEEDYGLGAEVQAVSKLQRPAGLPPPRQLADTGPRGASAGADTFSFSAQEGFAAGPAATPQKLRPIGRPTPVALPASRFGGGDDLVEEEL